MPLARFLVCICVVLATSGALACDACRSSSFDPESGGGVGLTAGFGDKGYRWSLETTFEYRNHDRINPSVALEINERENGHIHSTIDEWFIAQRVGYNINKDLQIGLSQNLRHLRDSNTTDPLLLGNHSFLTGFGDLEFDIKYRFKEQKKGGFPVHLAVFAGLKLPTGDTDKHTADGFLFAAHDQPGSGSWDGYLGMAVSKQWGSWGASGAISYSLKGEGSQNYKAGDILRLSLGASKKLAAEPSGWKLFPSLGVQAFNEFKGKIDGEIDRNHGGQQIFVIPGFSAKPIDRLTLGISAPVPAYQEYNGTHQRLDFSVQFNIGVRF